MKAVSRVVSLAASMDVLQVGKLVVKLVGKLVEKMVAL